jgi:hypothetical protein
MSDRTPTTAAGRELALEWRGGQPYIVAAILAIEAEAQEAARREDGPGHAHLVDLMTADAAEARAPLEAEIERLRTALTVISDGRHPDGHRGAVLVAIAALEEHPPGPQYTEDDPDWAAMPTP